MPVEGAVVRRARRRLSLAAVVFVLALILALGLGGRGVQAAAPELVVVESGEWRPWTQALGQVKAWRETRLTAATDAQIVSAPVETGEYVKQGQLVVELRSPQLQAQLYEIIEVKRRVDFAEDIVKHFEGLYKEQLGSLDDLLVARQSMIDAREALNEEWATLIALVGGWDSARLDRDAFVAALTADTLGAEERRLGRQRAPFAGTLAKRAFGISEWVRAGADLAVIRDSSRVYVDVSIPPDTEWDWRASDAVAQGPRDRFIPLAPLSRLASADTRTGMLILRYTADNPDGILADGQWVQVIFRGAPRKIVWVPVSAVVGRDGKTYSILRRSDAYEPVEVVVGGAEGPRIPVLKGLKAGDEVVVKGAYELLYRDLNRVMEFED